VGLALALLGAPLDARAEAPAPAAVSASEAPLEVELGLELGEVPDGQRASLRAGIEADLAALGEAHGFALTAEHAPTRVDVEIVQPQGQASVLLLTTVVSFEGETIAEARESVCLRCTPEEVVDESLAIIPDAMVRAHELAAAEPEPSAAASAGEEVAADDGAAPPPGLARAKALGPAGYVGISAGALGLGVAIAGTFVLSRVEVLVGEPGAVEFEKTNLRPIGVGMIMGGLGAMVVGNVLLAVDLSVLRERRRQRARLTSVGVVTQGYKGLAIRAQF